VNDEGIVVGQSRVTQTFVRGFVSFDGIALPLSEGGQESAAEAVSNGEPLLVAGWMEDGIEIRPVRWAVSTAGGYPSLMSFTWLDDRGAASGINDRGDVVGFRDDRPVIWRFGGTEEVISPDPSFPYGGAIDINNAGMVSLTFSDGQNRRGYVRLPDGSLHPLPVGIAGGLIAQVGDIGEVGPDGIAFVAGTVWVEGSESSPFPVRWAVDAVTGAVQVTLVDMSGGIAVSTSDAGSLAGSARKKANDVPVIWTESGRIRLPLPRGANAGRVQQISGNGNFATGGVNRMGGAPTVLWVRTP
jgi:hypothetical protein